MSVAALVLAIIATVLALISLSWQLISFVRQGPRPKLTPVVGVLTPEGLVTNDAGTDVREPLLEAAENLPAGPFIIGVKVVNAGREPLHIDGWAVRADPGGTSLVPIEKPIGGSEAPLDLAPASSAIFLTELQQARRFATAVTATTTATSVESAEIAEVTAVRPPRIVLTVHSGARTYVTKPVAPELFSLNPGEGVAACLPARRPEKTQSEIDSPLT